MHCLVQVSIISSLRHPNVVMFMGLCLQPPCIVTEFCARGSLFDVLRKARTSQGFAQQLDWSKRLSMALDAAKVCCLFMSGQVLVLLFLVHCQLMMAGAPVLYIDDVYLTCIPWL